MRLSYLFEHDSLKRCLDRGTAFHVTDMRNLPRIRKEGLIPQVPRDFPGERKAVYMFPNREDMETALAQWLGERWEDVEEKEGPVALAILEIDIQGLPDLFSDAPYEIASPHAIGSERILHVEGEDGEPL